MSYVVMILPWVGWAAITVGVRMVMDVIVEREINQAFGQEDRGE